MGLEGCKFDMLGVDGWGRNCPCGMDKLKLSLLETSVLLQGDLAALCVWDLPVPTSQAFPSSLFCFPCSMSSFFGVYSLIVFVHETGY